MVAPKLMGDSLAASIRYYPGSDRGVLGHYDAAAVYLVKGADYSPELSGV